MSYFNKWVNVVLICILGCISLGAEGVVGKEGKSYAEDRLTRIYEDEQRFFESVFGCPEAYSGGAAERQAEQIIRDYEAFINDNENYVEGYLLLGKFLRQIGQADEANHVFLIANKIDAEIAVVKQQIGNYLAEKGDFGLAMHYYLNAIELEPEVSIYHYCLGELYYQYKEEMVKEEILTENEYDRQIVTAFEEAIRLEPEDRVLRFRLAEAYYDLYRPDWKKALRLWDELERSSTEDLDKQVVALHQARVLAELDRTEDSKAKLGGVTAQELQGSKVQVEEKCCQRLDKVIGT